MSINYDRIIDRFLEVQSNDEIFDNDTVPVTDLFDHLPGMLEEFIELLDFESKLHKIARDVSNKSRKVTVAIDRDDLLFLLNEFPYMPSYQAGATNMIRLKEDLTKAYKEEED